MIFDVSMDWLHCPDGAELFEREREYDEKKLKDFNRQMGLPPDHVPDDLYVGKCIRYKSDVLEPRTISAINYRNAIALKFASANSDEKLVEFISEYGFPNQLRLVEIELTEIERALEEQFSATILERKGKPLKHIRQAQANMLKLVRSKSLKKFSEQFEIGLDMSLPVPKRGEQPRLLAQPNSLLELMELEVAFIICGEVETKTCPTCLSVFAMGGRNAKRRKSKYCSPNCRLKAYRNGTRKGK